MSVINRIEISNCINLDNYHPNQKEWSPHYPYLEINFRGLSAAIKAANGTGKTTINNGYYALVTRDRLMTTKFKSRMAPKRKSVWSHFRLEMLYQTPEDSLRRPQLFGADVAGEAWVFGMYGYNDDELRFYLYRGHFEDCPVVLKDGHKRSLVHNDVFISTLKTQTDSNTLLTTPDWKKAIGRHIDEKLTQKMLAYHKAGGGDGTENFFKVDTRAGEDYDTAFFYNHIAPETLVDCMGRYAEDDERGFEDTLLKSATEVITAKYEVDKSQKKINKLSHTHETLSAAKAHAEDCSYAQEHLEKEAREVLAEYHFLRQGVVENPLPLLPVLMTQNSPQTQFVSNGMVLQDGEWLFPDYLLSELIGSESCVINQLADRKRFAWITMKRSQLIENPCDLMIRRREDKGKPGRVYGYNEALAISNESTSFAEGWSRDAALRAINYAWDWRTGEGEHNIFRKLGQDAEVRIKERDQQIYKCEAGWDEKNDDLQRLNNEIQGIEQAVQALSAMRQSSLFSSEELTNPLATEDKVKREQQTAIQELSNHEDRNVALEDGRKSHARVTQKFSPLSPSEAREILNLALEDAEHAVLEAKQSQTIAKNNEQQACNVRAEAQEKLDGLRDQKGEIDHLAPYMRQCESLFPGEAPCALAESVSKDLQDAVSRKAKLEVEIDRAEDLDRKFGNLASGVAAYRDMFGSEAPNGLVEVVTRALSDAQYEIEKLTGRHVHASNQLTELVEGQLNLHEVQLRFGSAISVKTLEAELEKRERDASAVLLRTEQQVDYLTPLVTALDVFEQTYPDEFPAKVLQRRGERRSSVAVEMSHLNASLRITRHQIAGLESGGGAAGKIGSEVLECVGGAPLLVHQVIKDMALSVDRERAVMAHFSHALHCPAYADTVAAKLALARLDEAGIEVPIFSLDGLQAFCRSGDLVLHEDSVRGLLVGIQTPQVKALLDPSLVPDLIRGLQNKAKDIERELDLLAKELTDLAPDSEISQIIAQANQAVKEDARLALSAAKELCRLTTEDLETIREQRSIEVIRVIRLAANYMEVGGDLVLEQQKAEVSWLSQKIDELNVELPKLRARASGTSLSTIHLMLDFLKLGGEEERGRNNQALRVFKQSLAEVTERLPKLQSRQDQLPIITSAKRFVELGGWVKADALESTLIDANNSLNAAQHAEASAREHLEQVAALVESTNNRLIDASKIASTWKGDLDRATEFEGNDGMSFDATYVEHKHLFLENVRRADKRSRFQFDLAQQATDAEKDPFFHDNKVKQRDDVNNVLKELRNRITNYRSEQDAARVEVETHRRAAEKADAAAKRILDQWKAVHKITRDLPLDQRGAPSTSNMFVEDSMHIASDLREAFSEGRWNDALEKLDGLAENAESFPLSQRQQSINELTKTRQLASNSLKKEVRRILDLPENGLSEGEIEALSNPHTEADLTQSVLNLYRIIDAYLIKAEEKLRLNEQDVAANKQRMLDSMAGFSGNAGDNFDLLKRVMSTKGGGASIKISGTVIGSEGMKEALNGLVEEIDTQLSRRREDIEAGRGAKESEHAFNNRLRDMVRSEFYRAVFRADANDSSGPRVFFNHPRIGGGRDIPLSKEVSTGQYNALALLILVKLADFSLRRDARDEYNGMAITRTKRVSSARTAMIDGLFSNLSDKKMIRESLSVLRSLKGSFQLIGWIHNPQYDNDYELFPGCVTIRRTGLKRGYVLAEDANAPPLPETEEVAIMEAHISPVAAEEVSDD